MLARQFCDPSLETLGMAALIGRLNAAVFIVERSGRLTYANAAGQHLIDRGWLIQDGARGLTPVDADARRLVALALGGDAVSTLTTVIGGRRDRRVLSILPPSEETGGHAVVMVTAARLDGRVIETVVARAYRLTPAETRVLAALLRRRTLGQIAGDLGVTLRTVRAHLQRLFEKTGTHRQGDLLVEVLGLVAPLCGI